jgi:hypothetical protein
MKCLSHALVLGGVFLAACDKKPEPAPAKATNSAAGFNNAISNNSSGNPLSAPADYLGALAKGKQTSESVIDTVSLNKSVQLFYAQEGHYPADLDELVKEKYLPRLPAAPYGMKLTYDAKAGEVKMVKQ